MKHQVYSIVHDKTTVDREMVRWLLPEGVFKNLPKSDTDIALTYNATAMVGTHP